MPPKKRARKVFSLLESDSDKPSLAQELCRYTSYSVSGRNGQLHASHSLLATPVEVPNPGPATHFVDNTPLFNTDKSSGDIEMLTLDEGGMHGGEQVNAPTNKPKRTEASVRLV